MMMMWFTNVARGRYSPRSSANADGDLTNAVRWRGRVCIERSTTMSTATATANESGGPSYGIGQSLCIALLTMGQCISKDQKEGKRLNRRIDEQIKKDQSMSLRIIKLLLLELYESKEGGRGKEREVKRVDQIM
ncbi:hypothetical protein DICVIV_06712 [Dictyocaulus viviparus]|uniref:Uncharacterized protein n=1 Tax=Dictyocaulus viviparus TaxID=29172 RepID=A0A0D8XXY0_DICVI|nr:hypothetical protein DICVIV_06712 [Dictyocaulus viviparus]